MAIVVYKCDTCKRDVELLRNIRGLETPQRCIVTLGCRGKLYQSHLHPDYTRASITDSVAGLDDWQQRRVLYNHTQTIENTSWTIVHNLGTYPYVSVFVNRPTSEDPNNQDEIIPDNIEIVDNDTIVLHFSRGWAGVAQLVTRTTDPQLVQASRVVTSLPQATPLQISSNGYIVIATRLDKFGANPNTNIDLVFTSSAGSETKVTYGSTTTTTSAVAWTGVSRISIKGKIFVVRQFKALTADMSAGSILNGTRFRFKGFDFDGNLVNEWGVDPIDSVGMSTISSDDIIVLLSRSPFDSVDRITSEYLDITSVTTTLNPFDMFYDSGEFFAFDDILKTTYPPIRSI
jgi:hypothetical protein